MHQSDEDAGLLDEDRHNYCGVTKQLIECRCLIRNADLTVLRSISPQLIVVAAILFFLIFNLSITNSRIWYTDITHQVVV